MSWRGERRWEDKTGRKDLMSVFQSFQGPSLALIREIRSWLSSIIHSLVSKREFGRLSRFLTFVFHFISCINTDRRAVQELGSLKASRGPEICSISVHILHLAWKKKRKKTKTQHNPFSSLYVCFGSKSISTVYVSMDRQTCPQLDEDWQHRQNQWLHSGKTASVIIFG